ncbi:MAG: RNA polymerase sigma-70 factor [Bacteroidota bacterium]
MNDIGKFEEQTLELLFRSHYKGLCQFAMGYVKQDEVAKEIVQDAFVSLWEKRHTIDLSKAVKSYLSTTVRNKCLNHLRDHKKFSVDLLALENLSGESGYDQPDKLVEKEISEKIAAGIAELPEKCREIFILNRYENLRYQQIADKLRISVKTVETQMSKALQHMRLRLAEYLPLILFLILLNHFFAISPFTHNHIYFLPGVRDCLAIHHFAIYFSSPVSG